MEKRKEKLSIRPLPLYIYRGQIGVIYMNDFISEKQAGELDLTADDCELCYDDTVFNGNEYSGSKEITYQPIINDENEQKLISQWVYVETAKEDKIKQRYLTITDKYYDWTSDITQCVKQIEDTLNSYFYKLDILIKKYLSRAQVDINNCHPEVEVYTLEDVINLFVSQFEGNLKEFVEIITAAWRAGK